jgi:hypothetical protein
VKPLLYLTYRTFVNGLKRALTTPRRLISLIVFLFYYFLIFVQPALVGGGRRTIPDQMVGRFDFPLQIIEASAFFLFGFISLILLLGVVSYQTAYKPSDVDVLFSTPISPKLVLLFRMIRDYLITLLVPLVIIVLGLRPIQEGWTLIFRNIPNPEYSGLAMRTMALSWILVAMCWVTISYMVSLLVNRNDVRSDRDRKILYVVVGTLTIAIGAYIVYHARGVQGWEEAITLSQDPVLRSVFFTATFATHLTMAPIYGSVGMALFGAGSLVAIILIATFVSISQAPWMYDQAAVKAFSSLKSRQLQASGDLMGMVAERARQGKVRIRSRSWVHRLRWQGVRALLWKDLLLQPRSMLGVLIMLATIGTAMCVIPAFAPLPAAGTLLLVMQGVTVLMITMGISQTGFIELLRRVDLQKPLPFSPAAIVFYEVAAKALIACVACVVGAALATAIQPPLWQYALAAVFLAPFMSLLLSSCVFFVTMLFPDLDDPSQRQFRGLMTILAFAVCGFLPVTVFAFLGAVLMPLPMAALVGSLIAMGIAAIMAAISGALYANFNPSE